MFFSACSAGCKKQIQENGSLVRRNHSIFLLALLIMQAQSLHELTNHVGNKELYNHSNQKKGEVRLQNQSLPFSVREMGRLHMSWLRWSRLRCHAVTQCEQFIIFIIIQLIFDLLSLSSPSIAKQTADTTLSSSWFFYSSLLLPLSLPPFHNSRFDFRSVENSDSQTVLISTFLLTFDLFCSEIDNSFSLRPYPIVLIFQQLCADFLWMKNNKKMALQMMLRVVPFDQRTIAIGVNWTFLRLFGNHIFPCSQFLYETHWFQFIQWAN